MHESAGPPEILLNQAIAVIETREGHMLAALDEFPAPIYVTDPDGVITYFNAACIDFAGRTPVPGKDRWCVTWKLYTTDGEFLPHDSCPMAEAVLQKRSIRGATAIAERPDGTRVRFRPYPTPIFSEDGNLRCAVNMLIDLTDKKESESFRAQAENCRRHALSIGDKRAAAALNALAEEYEAKAAELDRWH
jgi:PAS domain S-box-containing protein